MVRFPKDAAKLVGVFPEDGAKPLSKSLEDEAKPLDKIFLRIWLELLANLTEEGAFEGLGRVSKGCG